MEDEFDHIYNSMPIDEYYNFQFGKLEYRSIRFHHTNLPSPKIFPVSQVNFTNKGPYTRIVEHKHFEFGKQDHTIITREYPSTTGEPYYPINDELNNTLYKKYKALAEQEKNIEFGGRLADYKYYDMHQVIAAAQVHARKFLQKNYQR